ncbi:DpnII family type II restriction endonuclease [Mycoplasma sp. 332]|uniref:DpnII family type II restriction endonuclease n=1 Tax=Mycoplasma sp. 332 TaxID=3458236 RepID=UPI004036945A
MNVKNELLEIFIDRLLVTNRGYDFFVDWENISEIEKYAVELHAMDSLIKSHNFKERFFDLLDKVPSIITTFPLLIAVSKIEREKLKKGKTSLLINNYLKNKIESFSFCIKENNEKISDVEKEQYYSFFVNTGLKKLFDNFIEKSCNDYIVGVLVGLDSNGRKNRSGSSFEKICERLVASVCKNYGITLLLQKQFNVLKEYGFNIGDDIANRKADFILVKDKKALNIETNYFYGPGSKPEEIIDSYINRQKDLNINNIDFILITDGNCWKDENKSQLNKAFRYIKLINYKMASEGYLIDMIKKIFELD